MVHSNIFHLVFYLVCRFSWLERVKSPFRRHSVIISPNGPPGVGSYVCIGIFSINSPIIRVNSSIDGQSFGICLHKNS